MQINEKVSKLLCDVKNNKPLVHHITNYVTANDCANIVLAIGGSPVMADDIEEVEEMVSIASCLVINIGTLNKRSIESMLLAGKKANEKSIPIVLDPVGIGATNLRTATTKKILDTLNVSIIRGNMSEIKMIAGIDATIKGVDSTESMENAEDIAFNLSKRLNCVIAITGKEDVISDGTRTCIIKNGHSMMSDVTGTGCMCTSLIGAYTGVTTDYYLSAVAGIASIGIAGEMAFKSLTHTDGIGTFKLKLFDNVYNLCENNIMKDGKIYER